MLKCFTLSVFSVVVDLLLLLSSRFRAFSLCLMARGIFVFITLFVNLTIGAGSSTTPTNCGTRFDSDNWHKFGAMVKWQIGDLDSALGPNPKFQIEFVIFFTVFVWIIISTLFCFVSSCIWLGCQLLHINIWKKLLDIFISLFSPSFCTCFTPLLYFFNFRLRRWTVKKYFKIKNSSF